MAITGLPLVSCYHGLLTTRAARSYRRDSLASRRLPSLCGRQVSKRTIRSRGAMLGLLVGDGVRSVVSYVFAFCPNIRYGSGISSIYFS